MTWKGPSPKRKNSRIYAIFWMWYYFCVISFIAAALVVLSLPLPTVTQNIEKAFLQNNSQLLFELLSARNPINISLPEPVYFSDQLSNQQAYFVFRNIFSSYSTFEFYAERKPPSNGKNDYIYQARWSFRDKRNNDQYLFYIFFYLMNESSGENKPSEKDWRITEIKAKKIWKRNFLLPLRWA